MNVIVEVGEPRFGRGRDLHGPGKHDEKRLVRANSNGSTVRPLSMRNASRFAARRSRIRELRCASAMRNVRSTPPRAFADCPQK